jgi:hypothetical protein
MTSAPASCHRNSSEIADHSKSSSQAFQLDFADDDRLRACLVHRTRSFAGRQIDVNRWILSYRARMSPWSSITRAAIDQLVAFALSASDPGWTHIPASAAAARTLPALRHPLRGAP